MGPALLADKIKARGATRRHGLMRRPVLIRSGLLSGTFDRASPCPGLEDDRVGRHASRDPAPPHGREDDREGSTSPRRWASGQTFGERAPTWTAGQPSPGPGERTTAWADIHPRPGPEEGTTAWADIIPVQTSGGKEARTWGNLPTPGLLSQGERPPAWGDINPRTYVSPPPSVRVMVRGRPPGPTCTNRTARGC